MELLMNVQGLPFLWCTTVSILAVVVVVKVVLFDELMLLLLLQVEVEASLDLRVINFVVLSSFNSIILNKSEKLLEYLFCFQAMATWSEWQLGAGELVGAGGGGLLRSVLESYVPFLQRFILIANAFFNWLEVIDVCAFISFCWSYDPLISLHQL